MKVAYTLKAIKKLGLIAGLKLGYAIAYDKTIHVALFGGKEKLLVRAGQSDAFLFFNIFVNEEYECKGQYELILDLGANVGYAAVYFAHHYPDAIIKSYEPDEENARIAKLNTVGYPNIEVINKGIWWRQANLRVVDAETASWALEFEEAQGGGVEAVSIDSLLDGQRSTMVKMDIEGAEREIFSNDSRFFDMAKCLQVEIHDCWTEFFVWASNQEFTKVSLSGENIVVYK